MRVCMPRGEVGMTKRRESRLDTWLARLERVPRLARMLLNGLIALLMAALLALLLSLLLGEAAFTEANTALFLFGVAMGGGLVAYVIGYWNLLGFDREANPRLTRRALYYVLAGAFTALILIIWLVISLIITALPPEIPL
jgi:hypothetical protein